MTEAPPPTTSLHIWQDLLDYLGEHGVVEETLDGVPSARTASAETQGRVLVRRVDGNEFFSVIPKGFVPERPIGPGRWLRVCADLRVPRPHWPIEF